MKNSNGIGQLSLAAALAAILGTLPLPVLCGQPSTPPATNASDPKSSGYNLEVIDGKLVLPKGNVEATLGNVIDALRDQYTEANLILAPGLAKLKVADLKLRAGRLLDELEGLRVATGGKFEVQSPSVAASTIDPTTGLPREGSKPNAGLFVLRDPPPTGPRERVVEAFNVGPYLDWTHRQPNEGGPKRETEERALNELMSIIQDTVNNFKLDSPDTDRPSFQYHPGATLLVVIGNVDSVEVARKIVNAMPGMNAVADSARARYGLATPAPEDRAAADEAFRKRYGLIRSTPPSNQPANVQPAPDSSPVDKQRQAAEDAFRKRYGLGPSTAPSHQPANPSQPPDTSN